MVSRDYIQAEEEAIEQWVDEKLVGDGVDDFPSVRPEKVRQVNPIASAAKEPKEFDRSLAQEMNQLSLSERERKCEEVHGISSFMEETPDLVYEALFELEREVAAIEPKTAYDMALKMDRSYVEGRKFRLMFLRAELFDVKKAAERMVLFLEKKLKFFGPASLVRSIQMSDLDDDDITTLKSGVFQILPSRDRSGRPILFKCSNCGPRLYTSLLSYCKCWWYSVICALEEDEENQKRGVVVIVWWMDYIRKDPDVTPEMRKEVFGAIKWLPMRPYNSIHVCMDNSILKKLLSRVQIALSPPEIRYSYKIHTGTPTEVLYQLMAFGIPTDAIPVSATGAIKTKELHKWIVRRKKREDEMGCMSGSCVFDRVDLPSLKDVLLAKGRPYQNHPGNLEYLLLVNKSLREYDHAKSRKDKRRVVQMLVASMKEKSARFLTKDKDGWWVETPEKELYDKVVKAFSHASMTARKKFPSYAIEFAENPSGKRKRIEPRMDVNADMPRCLDQSCFILSDDWMTKF